MDKIHEPSGRSSTALSAILTLMGLSWSEAVVQRSLSDKIRSIPASNEKQINNFKNKRKAIHCIHDLCNLASTNEVHFIYLDIYKVLSWTHSFYTHLINTLKCISDFDSKRDWTRHCQIYWKVCYSYIFTFLINCMIIFHHSNWRSALSNIGNVYLISKRQKSIFITSQGDVLITFSHI